MIILPDQPWRRAAHLWRRAEELGFAHAWTYDHLTWRSHRDEAWFSMVPTLTAAAVSTTTLRLGPLVASPNFRHPLPFVKDLITLDDISGGRLNIGIGAGGTGWDATMLGHAPWTPRERSERFGEFVALTDRLLRERKVTSDGSYYTVDEARTFPGPRQLPRPPLAIAASGPRGMSVVAAHGDIWVTTGARTAPFPVAAPEGARDVRAQLALLEEACGAIGRDVGQLDRLVVTGPTLDPGLTSREHFTDTVGCYASAGATDLVVHWPRPTPPYQTDVATFEDIFAP